MWKKKLRKKKFQFAIVGIILFFASMIFSACLSFTVETWNYAAGYFSKENSPDVFVNVGSGKEADQLLEQAKNNKDFKRIVTLDGRKVDDKILFGGRDITPGYFNFYALNDYSSLSWKITPIAGNVSEKGPGAGEVWVTGVFADQNGIKTGDKISVQGPSNVTLTVSSIISDATCPSSMFGVYPFYVSQSTLASSISGKPCELLAINSYSSYSDVETWLRNRPPEITKVLGPTFNVSQLLLSFTMFTLILGSIGMLSAIMIFVVSIIIIRFLIKNNLLKEYRLIGIYKALGFTDQQIAGFYLKCYALVGAAGLALGAAAGLPLGIAVGSEITRYIAGFHITYLSVLSAAGGTTALFALLLFSVWRAHRRIRRITPVQALQIGMSSSPKKLKRSLLRNAYSPLATAINDIYKHPSFSVMFVLILTASFYLSMFFISINYTCKHIADNSQIWFGLPKADSYISGNLTAEKIAAIQKDEAISTGVYGTPLTDVSVKTEKNDYGVNFNECSVISWNDLSNRDFFSANKSGRPPKYANEIAVSSGAIKGTSLAVGDYITLTIGNSKKSYLVTGIYDNMIHAFKTIEMAPQGLKESGIDYNAAVLAVNLKSGADYASFTERMKQYPGLTVERKLSYFLDSIKGVEEIINPVTIILVAVFTVFSLLNIVNLLLTTQSDNRRKFGILKAMGFSSSYISMQSIIKTLLLSLLGAVFAIALHLTLSPVLFYAFMGVNAFTSSLQDLIILIASIFTGIIALTLLFCIPLSKISPVELMEE